MCEWEAGVCEKLPKKKKEKEKGKRKVLKFGGEFVVIGLEGF